MGLNARCLEHLLLLKQLGHLPSPFSVVEIGAQQLDAALFGAPDRLAEVQRQFNLAAPFPIAAPGPRDAAPLARGFWIWMGASYASIDIDGTPGSLPLDLNCDDVPARARGTFDLVTNFGTSEHIANQLNVFKVIHDLAKLGGVFMHEVPAQGMWNHGLVNYTPKFFWRLARSNGYEVLFMDYVASPTPDPLPANVVDYISQFSPDLRQRAPAYGAPDSALVVVLRKAFEVEFVAPLDVPDTVTTDNPDLRKRYWTVLEPDGQTRLAQLPANRRAPRSLMQRLRRLWNQV